jgi:Uma2 family endonuclease
MVTAPTSTSLNNVADLLRQLGDIPSERIRLKPAIGTATSADVTQVNDRGTGLCELVDGTLVEKAVGFEESLLAVALIQIIVGFVNDRDLGMVSATDGTIQLWEGLVRIPDVAFFSWERLAGKSGQAIPEVAPELAIEVIFRSNTPKEMQRKREEYFQAGVHLVWQIDHRSRMVQVYTTTDDFDELTSEDMLTGGGVLPGFEIKVSDLFSGLDRLKQKRT